MTRKCATGLEVALRPILPDSVVSRAPSPQTPLTRRHGEAPLVARRSLGPRATLMDPCDRLVNRPELLVVRRHLPGLAVRLLEDRETANEVEQVRRTQHPGGEHVLAMKRVRSAQSGGTLL